MSLTLTSGIQAQKDALSKAPVWVLKIEFATGTLYVGSQTLTIVAPSGGADWVLTPWVRDWGTVDDVMPTGLTGAPILVGDMTLLMKSDGGPLGLTGLFSYLNNRTNTPEKTTVTLYEWYQGLDASVDPPVAVWKGQFEDWTWADEHTLNVVFTDKSVRNNKPVGTPIDTTTWPNADPDDIGKIEPIIYGSVFGAPCLAVDAGANSPVSIALTAAATVLYYSNTLTGFTATGDVYVDSEQITYTGKTTEVINGVTHGKLTGLTRGVSGTTAVIHNIGAPLAQVQAAYKYLVAGHTCLGVPAVYVNDTDGNPVKQLGTDYTVDLDDAGKTTISFSVLPKLVKQLNLAHTDTNTDNIAATSSAITVTETQTATGTFPSAKTWNSASGTDVFTFPAIPGGATFVSQLVTIDIACTTEELVGFVYNGIKFQCGNSGYTLGYHQLGTGAPPAGSFTVRGTSTMYSSTSDDGLDWARDGAGAAGAGANAGAYTAYSVTRQVTYTMIPTITKTGSVTGTGTLTGNSAADTVIGGLVTCDVQGYADDGSGTYTGTPGALINKAVDVVRHFDVVHGGYAFADVELAPGLAADMGSTYSLNGRIDQPGKSLQIAARMAFESRLAHKAEIGKARLTMLKTLMTPDFIVTTDRLKFLQGSKQSLLRRRVSMNEVINKVVLRYNRDWTKGRGVDSYRSMDSPPKENTASQARYELQQRDDKFLCDWITDSTMASAVAQFYLDLYQERRELVTFQQGTQGLGKQAYDVVRIQDRLLPYGTGMLLESDLQPGSFEAGRKTTRTMTLLLVEEAEAMLNVVDKTANYTLVSPKNERTIFTNAGAAGTVVLALPAAVVGMEFGPFVVAAAFALRVDPNGSEVFTVSYTDADATSPVGSVAHSDLGAGKYIGCSTVGSSFSVRCEIAGKWKVVEKIGPLAKEP